MRNKNLKVSIGMPVYNGNKYIREALDSLLSQTHSNFELIISDNASTDATEMICREYLERDARISYIRQEKNFGPIWNFNFVLQLAQGEYFMWAAHDDIWDKDWLTKLLNNHCNKTVISFGHVVNINEDNQLIRSYRCFKHKYSGSRLMRLIYFYLAEDELGKANIINGLYKSSLIKRIRFNEYSTSQYGLDMLLVFDCLQYGRITIDPTVLLYKRVVSVERKRISFFKIIANLLILPQAGSYLTYPFVVSSFIDKIIIGCLFPVKYLMSFIYRFGSRFLRHISLK